MELSYWKYQLSRQSELSYLDAIVLKVAVDEVWITHPLTVVFPPVRLTRHRDSGALSEGRATDMCGYGRLRRLPHAARAAL
jgi:hypothetical protein